MSEQDAFMRVAGAIGDLGSPFYQEERQRDVWNEASAVGFQAMLWGSLVAANVMIWVGRTAAVPYALGLMVVIGVASLLAIGYAKRSGVDVDDATRLQRPATALVLLLFVGIVVGLLVSVEWDAGGFAGGMAIGAAVGAGVGVAAVVGRLLWRHRRA